jgi:hypothetical protein
MIQAQLLIIFFDRSGILSIKISRNRNSSQHTLFVVHNMIYNPFLGPTYLF